MNHWPIILLTVAVLSAGPVLAGEMSGVVSGHDGAPVRDATVVLCDQDTGIPVSKHTFRPFVGDGIDLKSIAVATTDADGKFRLENVLDGRYRLVAQSWPETPAAQDIFEKNGREIILRGVADGILVSSDKATSIEIRPLGRCVVTLDERFPNSDALLLISTAPLSADPVLGFVSWRGTFLRNLIGANRMPSGFTRISGLPEGRIHLSVFGNDSAGGVGAGSVEARAGKTVEAEYIQLQRIVERRRQKSKQAGAGGGE